MLTKINSYRLSTLFHNIWHVFCNHSSNWKTGFSVFNALTLEQVFNHPYLITCKMKINL